MRVHALTAVVTLLLATGASAGGGPANVMVLYNADDPAALDVADYYQYLRAIPRDQRCALSGIDPTARTIAFEDYWTLIHDPLAACLAALPQPEEIDYLVVIRGLPYRVDLPDDGYHTSLSAMLQVHEAASTGDGALLAGEPQLVTQYAQASIDNPVWIGGWCQGGDLTIDNDYSYWYQSSCGIVRTYAHPPSFRRQDAGEASGYDFAGNLFVVTRLDGFDHQDAMDLVERAVWSDGTFPPEEILCMEGADAARGARDPECEFATRHLDLAGLPGAWLTPHDSALAGHTVAAYFTGAANIKDAIDGNTFVPGAITGNVTSYGAAPQNFFCDSSGKVCPESESQTSVARFVRAGATGAHGTVAEPLNNVFPNAGTLLYYTFGYNLGESYFFNQQFVYWVNLYLGDPLATPYATRPLVQVEDALVPEGGDLTISAGHPDGVAEVRLYVDGVRVASAEGDTLAWPVEGSEGDVLDVLAVAVAENAPVDRPGWPETPQLPQPDVQGWTQRDVEILAPDPGDDDSGGDDDAADDDAAGDDDASGDDDAGDGAGCECEPGGPDAADPVPLALLLVCGSGWLRLRRRRP